MKRVENYKNSPFFLFGILFVLSLLLDSCDKPDRITKWRYVPEEIDNAEVILTINETQGLAEVECTPEFMEGVTGIDGYFYVYRFNNGFQYLIRGDSLFLLYPISYPRYEFDTLETGIERLIVRDKTEDYMRLESYGFGQWLGGGYVYIESYDFHRLPFADL
jgi:hypothetical protein